MDPRPKRPKRKNGEGSVRGFIKKCRSEGKPYVTLKKKKVEGKSEPSAQFSCKCKFQCSGVPHNQRKLLFHDFHGLEDSEKQNSYLMGLMTITPVKRRRNGRYEDPEDSRRQATIWFQLPDGGGDLKKVCRNTFLHVFNITRRRVATLIKAKKMGDVTYKEKRGKKIPGNKYTQADFDLVYNHINEFPREPSHHGRSKSSKEYLSQDLNIFRLYRAFKAKYPDANINQLYYRRIFKKHFPHIAFHSPRSDTCSTCDLLHVQVQTNPNDRKAKQDLEFHHLKAKKARVTMQEDIAESQMPSSKNGVWSIDPQQVWSLPALVHGEMFYLRQHSNYNLGIHIADVNKGCMYLWHEGMSGRGSNEIASCIFKAVKAPEYKLKRSLTIWSDNCSGQNKNRMLVFLFIYLVVTGVFDEIHHKFLVPGHSYLPCDRDFAHIEKRKRVEKCEVPKDLIRVICAAVPNNPFSATMMQPEDFFDFKGAACSYINTSNLNISKVNWIKVEKSDPGVIKTRKMFNELEQWASCKVFKKNVTKEVLKSLVLPPLQPQNHIAELKKQDLRKMIPYLKPENRSFYEDLIS